ncbi:MAG: SRPBCC domain-containing protein [Rhizobiales bacterium]|nr:SRPBCC domain-containing protein [Hyphomicrobiales bacterium]
MSDPDTGETKRASLRLDCELDAPIEKVWRALSDPALLAQWLLPNDMVAEPGARFALAGSAAEGGTIACEILESDPPRRLSFSWKADGSKAGSAEKPLDTVVTFELEPGKEGGTRLRLFHDGFVVPADYPFEAPAPEADTIVLLPLDLVARRRLRKPRYAFSARRALPTLMRLAA